MPKDDSDLPSTHRWFQVCNADQLVEGGEGLRFDLPPWTSPAGVLRPAFVVRYDGQARAFLNQCAHVPVELDWQPGRFFEDSGLYLICATHGAMYRPDDGFCVAGPCRGRSLQSLPCREVDGVVIVGVVEAQVPLKDNTA